MLYIAFVKYKPGRQPDSRETMLAKSRKWWNDGDKPPGLKTVAFYGALGTEAPDVVVFEANDHHDIRRMIEYWDEIDFGIHPAVDLAEIFRRQGMRVS